MLDAPIRHETDHQFAPWRWSWPRRCCLAVGCAARRRHRGPAVAGSASSRRRPSSPTSSGRSAASRDGRLDRPGRRRARGLRAATGRRPALADAELIVSNGVGLDDFLDKIIAAGRRRDAQRLVLGDGIPTVTVDGEENPHFWLDPTLVERYYLPAIPGSLSKLRPADAADFAAASEAYAGRSRARRRPTCSRSTRSRREPQARDVPRRLPVFRRALRLRADRRHPPEPRARSPRRPTWRPSSRRSGGRGASGLLARRSSTRSSRGRWPTRRASRGWSRPCITTPSGRRRPTPTSGC